MCGVITGPVEASLVCSGGGEISAEAETRSQTRRRRAAVTRRLVTFAVSGPVPIASDSRERSWELLEKAFDNAMYCFEWGLFL